jgi:CubicO group peptidase (beta-lactamase class C family)
MTSDERSLAESVDATLQTGLDEGIYRGAAAAVGDAERVMVVSTVGHETDATDAPVTPATRFDVASLTKPVVTATITHRLVERGVFDLEATLGTYVDAAAGTPRADIPIRTLLTHTSGLPPYKAFPFGWESPEALLESLYESPLALLAEPDDLFVYSDLNFVHLADALRHATGDSLASLAETHVFEPGGMDDAVLGPLDASEDLATTYDGLWRDRHLRGEINDFIGAVMEGESGNAGLFATVTELAEFARRLLADDCKAEGHLLAPSTVETLRSDAISHLDRPHGLGWRLAHEGNPAPSWSDASFGHAGYTGTSLWIDPERESFAVLLTNRLLTDTSGETMAGFRRRFHAAVAAAIDHV